MSKQSKLLLQDRSSLSDNIKVYSEIPYSVFKREDVSVKRILILEKSTPTRKEVPVVEKKFKLIEEEFMGEMRVCCPKVKVHRGDSMIILEGPDKEVQSGATKLDKLMKTVIEKRVKLPSDLLTFIKSSGLISKYQICFKQSLRNPVLLEVGSDLVLSSLSSGALDDAWTALKRDLSLEIVKLQGAAAVPPELNQVKEILIKAKNNANRREFKVDVSFIPGNAETKVRLVGYNEDVNQLKEVLDDYQMNHIEIEEILYLTHPDFVDCFDKILSLIGLKQIKVTVKASHFPYPCVVVSGPRCHVQEVQHFLVSALANLTSGTLVLDRPRPQQYFQAEGEVRKRLVESSCSVLIREQRGVYSPDVKTKSPSISSLSPIVTMINKSNLKIKVGSLEDEQVDVLVVPIINRQPTSTAIGKQLVNKARSRIKIHFSLMASKYPPSPGDVVQVDGTPSLRCSKVFFIECLPWDGDTGQSRQALDKGLKKCLDLCIRQGFRSVAFPVVGHGVVLKYPLREAVKVLTENIREFGLSVFSRFLSNIHIVIKPGHPDSEECYHDVYRHLNLNMNQGGQVIFRSLTSDLDDVTITVGGGVKLQLVFGDITNETTDAVVNTTDFVHFNYGVCKDVLTKAGPQVEAILRSTKVNQGAVITTMPGSFPCKAILHVNGDMDVDVIEQLMCRIIKDCDSSGYKSVAIPAICAGAGGLEPHDVARAILRGIKTAISSTQLHCLTNIRLVLVKINVFMAFKQLTTQIFPHAVCNTASTPKLPHIPQAPVFINADRSIGCTSQQQQSVFQFVGLYKENVEVAMTKLKSLYQLKHSTRTFTKEDLERLTMNDMNNVTELVEILGLNMQMDQPSHGSLTLNGSNDAVKQVTQIIFTIGSLRREVRVKEEEELYSRVSWCILGNNGEWERLPEAANHKLEHNNVRGGIVDAAGFWWSVDLQRMDARQGTGQTKLKRLENPPGVTLPLHWDNMSETENLKVVKLKPFLQEYWNVMDGFKQTALKRVLKIERLQNIHLLRAYEVQKKHMSEKNAEEDGAGEKFLYHGTTQYNCNSIMKHGFNRSFAGQNATSYGCGTYFAVKARYAAQTTYSKPAADGSQFMFVARVLTGLYTQGDSSMKVPPTRDSQRPHDRYDSLVDNTNNPSMFVVFHDNQAYPDYLITFK